mgnify:FL=1
MNLEQQTVTRRALVTGAAAMGLAVPPAVARAMQGQQNPPSPAERNLPPVHIGFIGTGVQGQFDMNRLVRIPGVKIVATCDIYEPNLKKGLEIARGAQGYDDYRRLLERRDLHAVCIATPLHLHARMAIDALEAGKHVFVEKMMAYSIEEARQMVRAVRRTGKFVQVGHQRRYSIHYHHALDLIRKDSIGQITHVRAQWNRNGSWRRAVPDPKYERLINWRLYKASSQGLMAELGSHQIDVCNWFLNSLPVAVVGIGGIDYYKDGREVYDNVQVIYEYANGVKVTYQSLTTNAFDDCSEQFMGKKGTLIMRLNGSGELYRERSAEELDFARFARRQNIGGREAIVLDAGATTQQDKRERTAGVPLASSGASKDDYFLEFEDFIACVRENRKPFCDVEVGFKDTVCILKANEAMEKGIKVTFKPEDFQV